MSVVVVVCISRPGFDLCRSCEWKEGRARFREVDKELNSLVFAQIHVIGLR